MAVRLFEGDEHAAAYLQYRVAPQELISIVMSYVEKKVSAFSHVCMWLDAVLLLLLPPLPPPLGASGSRRSKL